MPARSTEDLADKLAPQVAIWRQLLADHAPDPQGRCQACRRNGIEVLRWPCGLRVLAELARDKHDSGRAVQNPGRRS